MNKYLLIILSFTLFNCKEKATNELSHTDTEQPIFITKSEAQSILGENAHLTDSSVENKKNVVQCNLTYFADSVDVKTGKTGNIYYIYEHYDQEKSANEIYDDIYKANAGHEGIKVLTGLGDEAYFHTDSQNFCFILIRKGANMVRMKVNKLTSKTSIDQLNAVAKRITDKM